MKHIISVLVENRAGVLSRISGLFSRRGYNIDSLAVGTTDDKTISRITIVADGDEYTIEQIEKQLNKLIEVIKVKALNPDELISCELVLIKVSVPPEKRNEIISITKLTETRIVDISIDTATVEIADNAYNVSRLIEMLSPFGIIEIVRTGTIAIQKGSDALKL